LKSEIRAPATDRAVQTAVPMISVTKMPVRPDSPMAVITSDDRITVTRVMPDTGLVPTMAMASAATGVNRKHRAKAISIPRTE